MFASRVGGKVSGNPSVNAAAADLQITVTVLAKHFGSACQSKKGERP